MVGLTTGPKGDGSGPCLLSGQVARWETVQGSAFCLIALHAGRNGRPAGLSLWEDSAPSNGRRMTTPSCPAPVNTVIFRAERDFGGEVKVKVLRWGVIPDRVGEPTVST